MFARKGSYYHIQQVHPIKRALFLGGFSLFLGMSFIMSFIATVPLTWLQLTLGRAKGLAITLGLLVLSYLLMVVVMKSPWLFGGYTMAALLSGLVSEVIWRKLPPVPAFLGLGTLLVLLLLGGLGAISLSLPQGPKAFLVEKIQEVKEGIEQKKGQYAQVAKSQNHELMALLNKPDRLADEVMANTPYTVVMGVFFALWLNMVLILRGKRFFFRIRDYHYSYRHLVNLKVPDLFVWPLILSLLMVLLGDRVAGWVNIVGNNALMIFALFYFFQGVGVLVALLDALVIHGLFRSFLVVLTIVTSYWVLAVVGLFDLWFNFRKIFEKKLKSNRGDNDESNSD